METSKWGALAEDFAVKLLKNKGYRIVERNFRGKFGEIDIIAVDGNNLVFVEVKARWSKEFGSPEEAVTEQKLSKISRTGQYFALLHPDLPKLLRIDVVALEISDGKVTSSKIIHVD